MSQAHSPGDDEEVRLVSDGQGLAIIGDPMAVQGYLRSRGLLAASRELDLRRLGPLLARLAETTSVASQISAQSARWIKLTEKSAQLVEEFGLTPSKVAGESHLMVGVPGKVQSWLQADEGVGSVLTNPATLSGVSAIMAQAAMQQAMAEITDYLRTIDVKVDDILQKIDAAVVAEIVGAGQTIERGPDDSRGDRGRQ